MTKLNVMPSIDYLNGLCKNTAATQLGIEILEVSESHLKGSMPVDHRTLQPGGILHGGASILFAETLGSIAAACHIDNEKFYCVGQEINGNHIRSVSKGHVYGVATPHHIGRRSHVWAIEITDDKGKIVCISRLTIAVIVK